MALQLLVRRVTHEADRINSYELVHPAGLPLPAFEAGAHIDVHLDSGRVRQYSLCGDPSERTRYLIAVLREKNGRGGSEAMHRQVTAGSMIEVGLPRNNFQLATSATRHLLVAGGIGVTPLLSMAHHLRRSGGDFLLHHCVRSPGMLPFREVMQQLEDEGRLVVHCDDGDAKRQLDLKALLARQPPGTHAYYCGPAGFMQACADATRHWAAGSVHFEHFAVAARAPATDAGGGAFRVRLARSGRVLRVPPDKSIADMLEAAGVPVETSCRAGLCGACKATYLDGTVDHRDCVLTDQERGRCLTTCVSRSLSEVLTLDL